MQTKTAVSEPRKVNRLLRNDVGENFISVTKSEHTFEHRSYCRHANRFLLDRNNACSASKKEVTEDVRLSRKSRTTSAEHSAVSESHTLNKNTRAYTNSTGTPLTRGRVKGRGNNADNQAFTIRTRSENPIYFTRSVSLTLLRLSNCTKS